MKAMLFAAGLGTRLYPLTSDRPKALVEIQNSITLLHYNINYLKSFGIDTIIVNIHHFGQKVIDEIKKHANFGINIIVSDERGELLETGGGLKKAMPFLEGQTPILLYNVDVISNIDLHQMLIAHQANKALATLACRNRETARYLLFDKQNQLCGWKNTKTNEIKNVRAYSSVQSLAFSGIHIIDSALLKEIKQVGKFSITNVYLELAKKQRILSYQHDQDYWFDVGNPQKLATARQFLQK